MSVQWPLQILPRHLQCHHHRRHHHHHHHPLHHLVQHHHHRGHESLRQNDQHYDLAEQHQQYGTIQVYTIQIQTNKYKYK